MSIVGVSLTASMKPATDLLNGDHVRVVTTPGEGGDVAPTAPTSITATVVDTRQDPTSGAYVVDVLVPASDAAQLAAWSSTGKVAVILDSRER
jgi:hypothetical protein